MSDATPVASSATPAEQVVAPLSALDLAVKAGDMGAFKAAKAAERAGTPLTPSADQSAGTAPATPGEQAPADQPADSAPARPSGHRGNADTRIQELLADRARERERAERLERELAEIRRAAQAQPPKQAETAPATAPREPELADFEADPETYPDPYAAYVAAVAQYHADQRFAALEKQAEERRTAQERATAEQRRIETFQTRMAEAGGETFLADISDDVKGLRTIEQAQAAGVPLTPLNAVASELIESEHAPALMRYWTDHPEELRKLERAPNPRALLREFGRQEALATAPKAPAAPPPKVITTAPPPPTTTGNRPTEPVDALEAAVRSGDMAAFKALKQRERQAARAQR